MLSGHVGWGNTIIVLFLITACWYIPESNLSTHLEFQFLLLCLRDTSLSPGSGGHPSFCLQSHNMKRIRILWKPNPQVAAFNHPEFKS